MTTTETQSWCVARTGNHQGLVIDEQTGANIAVVYDKTNAPLLAAAPELLQALEDSAGALDAIIAGVIHLNKAKKALRSINERSRAAISKATGRLTEAEKYVGQTLAEQHGA